jgi:hypothetical protein
MSIVAVLVPPSTRSPLSEAEWASLIQAHPRLTFPDVRRGINPFTKEPMVLPPRRDLGVVVHEGAPIGTIEWAQDGSQQLLLVRAEPPAPAALLEVARDVAEQLGVDCETEHELVAQSRQEVARPRTEESLHKAIRMWTSGDPEGAVAHYMASFGVDLRTAVAALAKLAKP